jgi:hypothetical protein
MVVMLGTESPCSQSLLDAEDIDHHLPQWFHMSGARPNILSAHSQCSLEASSKCDFEIYILLVLLQVAFRLNIPSLASEVGESGERDTSISIAEEPGPILSTRATYSDHNVCSHIASRHFTMSGS